MVRKKFSRATVQKTSDNIYSSLVLKKHFILLSFLKTDVFFVICIFLFIVLFFQCYLKNEKFKEQDLFETEIFYKIIHAFPFHV